MKNGNKISFLIGLVVLIVVAAIIASLVLIGSPSMQRDKRLDQQRVSALYQIESVMTNYWTEEQDLPEDLESVMDRFYGPERDMRDPETDQPYVYERLTEHSYKLCAEFAHEGVGERYSRPLKDSYIERDRNFAEHNQGMDCFMVTYDPEAYEELVKDSQGDFPVRDPLPPVF